MKCPLIERDSVWINKVKRRLNIVKLNQ
jgi:hypothetical protein